MKREALELLIQTRITLKNAREKLSARLAFRVKPKTASPGNAEKE
jgi:hypothetical protein